MFSWSIRNKMFLMGGVCAASLLAAFTVGLHETGAVADALKECDAASTAQRNQMLADMMHDAIRADVMQALVQEAPELAAAADKDLPEHIEVMRRAMEENRLRVVDPHAKQAIEAVLPALTDYANAASSIVLQAKSNRSGAIAKLGEFYRAFDILAERMEKTADLIAAYQARTVQGDGEHASAAQKARATIWAVMLAGLLFIVAIGTWVLRTTVGPMRTLAARFYEIANGDGDLTVRVDDAASDEVGELARHFNQFVEKMRHALVSIAQDTGKIGAASQNIRGVSDQLAAVAEQTSAQAQVVSSAAEEIRANMESVSSGAAEMESNIRDIGRDASEAKRVADEGVIAAKTTDEWVARMGDRSNEIGEVIKVISSIAEQTNLLALNATIEAARAGEAGKGFAVVANEVKELAKETARATEDISKKIEAMQRDTRAAVSATAEIAGVIERINERQSTIALAVERQTLLTGAISQNVAEAARGSQDIAENITGVARAARETAEGASRAQGASRDLAELAVGLDGSVSQFRLTREDGNRSRGSRGRSRSTSTSHDAAREYYAAAEE